MSLATSAASWTTDDIPPLPTKKRQSTVRTATDMIGVSGSSIYESTDESYTPVEPMQETRKVQVNKLLDKLTAKGATTEGLVDYEPAKGKKMPVSSFKDPYLPKVSQAGGMNKNPMLDSITHNLKSNGVGVAAPQVGSLLGSSYVNSELPGVNRWASTPNARMSAAQDDKLLEKINYMIHLLEEQKMEKTNYVMEEFVLYTMLGVFVIYVVDSFSRSAKYIR